MDEEAVVIEDLNPEGKVEIDDEIWKATAKGNTFPKGEKVKVTGAQGLALIMEDLPKKEDQQRTGPLFSGKWTMKGGDQYGSRSRVQDGSR